MKKTKQRRRRGYTRLSSKHQITIPVDVLRRTGLAPGAELRVEADEDGRILLVPQQSRAQRRRAAIEQTAGLLTGLYPPGYLEELRDEWR